MNFGRLDRQIQLQSSTPSQNTSGEKIASWATYDTVWAEEIDVPAREKIASGTEQSIKQMGFLIRYRSDVTRRHRVVYNGENYDIEDMREIGRREALELRCVRHTG